MTLSLLSSPTRESSNRRRLDFGRGFATLATLAIIAFPMLWEPINATIDNVRIQNASYGLAAGTGARVMVNRSVFSGNTTAGIEADSGTEVNVNDSVLAHNGIGVQSDIVRDRPHSRSLHQEALRQLQRDTAVFSRSLSVNRSAF
jgi:hypothetical protein